LSSAAAGEERSDETGVGWSDWLVATLTEHRDACLNFAMKIALVKRSQLTAKLQLNVVWIAKEN
jgi:hypothetical protein